MSNEQSVVPKAKKPITMIAICGVIVVLLVVALWYWKSPEKEAAEQTPPPEPAPAVPLETKPVIDYGKVQEDQELKELMDKRKEEYGVGEAVDMIAKADETLKVGESTVPMESIMDKIQLSIGDIVEKDLGPALSVKDNVGFGIYVVQPGDNIWNVHFDFLKDYFARRDVTLSPRSDEPDRAGFSSGVGKLLKFSENVVHVYNLSEQRLDSDLSLIHPLTKIVIYHMDRIYELLDEIDYGNVDSIEFDGEMLWIPTE